MKMSKAVVKSDLLLAHQDLSVGSRGGEECGANWVKTERETDRQGGVLEGNER